MPAIKVGLHPRGKGQSAESIAGLRRRRQLLRGCWKSRRAKGGGRKMFFFKKKEPKNFYAFAFPTIRHGQNHA
jgi:hypothetical protein